MNVPNAKRRIEAKLTRPALPWDKEFVRLRADLAEAVDLLNEWVNGEGDEPVKATRAFLARVEKTV